MLLKPGTIIENYQGRFAKVVTTAGSRFGLTPFHSKRAQAEDDVRVVRFVNSFGLSQIIKPKSEATADAGREETLEEMDYAALKARAKELGLSTAGKFEDLRARIEEATADAGGE